MFIMAIERSYRAGEANVSSLHASRLSFMFYHRQMFCQRSCYSVFLNKHYTFFTNFQVAYYVHFQQ